MADIFQTRYDSLIHELDQVVKPEVRMQWEVFASITLYSKDQVVWESGLSEVRTPDLSLPNRPLDGGLPDRRWQLTVSFFSIDGLVMRQESWNLLPSASVKGDPRNLADLSPEMLSCLLYREDDRFVPVFDHSGRITGKTGSYLRVRTSKARIASDTIYQRRNRRSYKRPDNAPGKDGSSSTSWPTNSIRTVNGVVVNDTFGVFVTEDFSRSTTRSLTPNFFALKKWERPINPYTMQEIRTSRRLSYTRVVSLDQSSVTALSDIGPTPYFVSEVAPSLSPDPAAESKAFAKLNKNVDEALFRESSQTPTNVVQFRQVVNMIASAAHRIRGTIAHLKHGHFGLAEKVLFGTSVPRYRKKGGLSATKSVASNWLELQYGWKPLLQDIKNTTDSFHRNYHGDIRTARGVGRVQTVTETPLMGPFNASYASVVPFPAGQRVVDKTTRVEFGMRYKVSDSDRAILAQTGFLSPISLAWELIPYSFVVDWFYPIGPYLEGLAAFEGMTFVDGYKTTFVRETTGVLLNHSGTHGVFPQRITYVTRGGSQRIAVRMVRERLFSFPAQPRLRFKNPISVKHAQNALALLAVAFVPRK